MAIHLYLPALFTMLAGILAFFAGILNFIISFPFSGRQTWRQDLGLALGACFVYASPVVFCIGLGMQIAHWI
jgi:hypothetical protein